MNRITFSKGGDIRPAAVVLVGLVLSAIALALDTLIANAAPAAFGAPGEVSAFGPVKVLLASVPAVVGNTLGFYMSYRRYDPRALVKFLAPAAGFFVAFMVPPVWGLLAGGTFTAFAVASLLNIVPVAIAVPTLLGLRPGSQLGSAPAASLGNFQGLRAKTTVK
ncbi:MAG: hypothetical protein AVDCRST_MAG80-2621 [uncultured Rubrobacteraceae bacterium]|uniref:Uncharacterized protein n=1 Tax=uncultured Rubrobacteraceae bacterium TaxID=349277 RepID=A0A6J4QSQ0_9ACTN|nr:MAG: hypothetical protein AVDCRST_MAG80-2621 [uncultured Rubrobacteraceae bacterium]